MDVYKHSAVSFTASALLPIVFRDLRVSLSCFLTGVLIDLDHLLDYCVNHALVDSLGYLCHPKRLIKFLSSEYINYKPLCRVYKPLHSVELFIPVLLLYTLGIWNNYAGGALLGFTLHIIMDALAQVRGRLAIL